VQKLSGSALSYAPIFFMQNRKIAILELERLMLVMDDVNRVIQKITKSGRMCPLLHENVQYHPHVAISAIAILAILKIREKETPGLYSTHRILLAVSVQ
jgi:hypothetical protein